MEQSQSQDEMKHTPRLCWRCFDACSQASCEDLPLVKSCPKPLSPSPRGQLTTAHLLGCSSTYSLSLSLPWACLQFRCPSVNVAASCWNIYIYIYINSLILTFILKFHISFDRITFFREILCLWFSTSSAKQCRDLGKTGLFNLVSRAHTKGNCVGQSSSTGMNLSPS